LDVVTTVFDLAIKELRNKFSFLGTSTKEAFLKSLLDSLGLVDHINTDKGIKNES